MKKNVHFIFVFFTVFGVHTVLISAADAVINIMPLGNSITRGFSGSTDAVGYRRELYLALESEGYDIDFVGGMSDGLVDDFDKDHEGHSGFTSSQIAGMVYDYLGANPADIVLLHIGTNDISELGFNLNDSVNDVAEILDEIDRFETDNGKTIWVVLARIINRNCSLEDPPCVESEDTTDLNIAVEAMAQSRIGSGDKIVIVDMEDGAGIDYHLSTDVPPGDMADNSHPYDTGYEKMADVWFAAVQQIISAKIIGTRRTGIFYWDVAVLPPTQMTPDVTTGDIAAGDFNGDCKTDVASSWTLYGLGYQDGETLDWTQLDPYPAYSLTAGDVTGDGRDELIGAWFNGIWYYDFVAAGWTRMTTDVTDGDIAAGDFNGDGRADVATSWTL